MSSSQPDKADIPWVLAFAILDSLVDDLRLRRRQGFWKCHPDEMQDKVAYPVNGIPQPNDLLKELRSRWVQDLMDTVAYESSNRVRINISDLLRRARA